MHILRQPKVAGFLPLGALTPCKLHDASQKLEPDDRSGRRLCLCCGLSEVPEGCVCCWRPRNSLPVSLPIGMCLGRQRATGWGWGWVLNLIALRQPPAVRRPQTPDLDLPVVSAFFLHPFSRNLGLKGGLRGRGWGPGILAHPSQNGPCPWQPALSCSFSQGMLFSDFISNMWDYPAK